MYTIDEIKLLHHEGKLKEARLGYIELLRVNPRDVDVLHLLGLLCAEEYKLPDAVSYLRQARDISSENSSVRLHLANVLKAAGESDVAISELLEVIRLDAQCAPAYNNLGTIYFLQRKYQQAVESYGRALDIRADYADAYFNLGLAYEKLNRDPEAMNAFRALLKVSPSHPGARFHLGCILMKHHQYREAEQEFASITLEHADHFESLVNLASCHLLQGKMDLAASCYLRALEVSPGDKDVLFNLGVIHMRQGYANEAVNYYLRAVKSAPDFFEAHHNLAAYYMLRGDRERALQHFQEALRVQPENEALRHTLRILAQDKSLKGSSSAYIKSLFDSYAEYYEAHLRSHLRYELPEKLMAVLKQEILPENNQLDILDLGCGTGLCGEVLKPYARRLTGMDLSENMVEVARAKQIYDDLAIADAVSYLEAHRGQFDLIAAGDVLAYFGDLAELIAAVTGALKPKGYFIFNVEAGNGADYELTPSGRFTHQTAYLEQLARQYGFRVAAAKAESTRRQKDTPVKGTICLWQTPFGAGATMIN